MASDTAIKEGCHSMESTNEANTSKNRSGDEIAASADSAARSGPQSGSFPDVKSGSVAGFDAPPNPSSTSSPMPSIRATRVQKRRVPKSSTLNATSLSLSASTNFMNHASHLKSTHMNEMRRHRRTILTRLHYINAFTTVLVPLSGFLFMWRYKLPLIPQNNKLLVFCFLYYNLTLVVFNAGYHRLYAHNAIGTLSRPFAYFLLVLGASVGLGPARWWAALHRAHHRYTDDTDHDPYLIKRGFWWAHYGWLLWKPNKNAFYRAFIEENFPSTIEPALVHADTTETDNDNDEDGDVFTDPITPDYQVQLLWQQKCYLGLFLITTFVIPVIIAVLVCGDSAINGIIYPGIIRMFLCQQALLSTESICHLKSAYLTIPTQPFNDTNLSHNCNNPLVSLLTHGQAFQNFHHEFSRDYRASPLLFAYDPTKWFLQACYLLGLVSEMLVTPQNLISQLHVQQQQLVLNRMRTQLNWGTPISKLPLITPSDFRRIIASPENRNRTYIVIQNVIHDVTPFVDQHPGGRAVMRASHGMDATSAFYGGVYRHLAAAINLLATMRIGMLNQGNDEEVWSRVFREQADTTDQDASRETLAYRTAEAA